MQHYEDANPACFDAKFKPTNLKFSPNGKYLCLSGHGRIDFYSTKNGDHMKSLAVSAGVHKNQFIAFDRNSYRLAIGIDETIYFANIRPEYVFGVVGDTLVYKYEPNYLQKGQNSESLVNSNNSNPLESQISFWNMKQNSHCVKKVKNLITLATDEKNLTCVLAKNKDHGTIAVLCNESGNVIASKKLDFLAEFVNLTDKFIIIANKNKCIFWVRDGDFSSNQGHNSQRNSKTSLDGPGGAGMSGLGSLTNSMTHFNENSMSSIANTTNSPQENIISVNLPEDNSQISAVTAKGNLGILAFNNNLQCYSFPEVNKTDFFSLSNVEEVACMKLNCNNTLLGIIDNNWSGVFGEFCRPRGFDLLKMENF